ncbi:polymorphic toxin-type HINT domain-containing protein [Streptomyces caatingaensis]|uniref:polymorphic toxin-type HINT domain-containing protein n=1 Tax=Streptomyces caatingaensis TaxID=1678637 RepID=UPI000B075AE1|nr:polymorphic toxin-type HINT domain-containing protein [Streptomyces caatingaensis]
MDVRCARDANARKSKNTLYYAYDNLGRKTELHEGSANGTKLAEWTYDSVSRGKGKPASSTRFENGNAYTNRVTEYDSLYRITRSIVEIPSNEGPLAGEYLFGTTYNPSGSVQGMMLPKAGALSGDGVVYTYDKLLRPTEVIGSGGLKASVTSYSFTGKPLQAKLTGGGNFTQLTNGYEWGTQRLSTTRVDRENAPTVDKAATYTYDETGNVRAVSDAASGGMDTQCFTYDYLRRVTDEWTQSTPSCTGAPDGKLIGGPAPYWNSYTYDRTGNRLTETRHDVGGDSAKDIKRTYSYPPAGGPQPHTLTAVNTTSPTGTAKDSYAYDPIGNTTARTIGGDKQTLDWDAEGHLAKAVQFKDDKPANNASYLYDTEGQRLIGRTDSETTLYLGLTEITLAKGSKTPKATRYLDLGNGVQAVQNDDGSGSFVVGDHLGTGQLAIDGKGKSATHRRTTPFGTPRGEQPKNWPGTKGFVGGTNDTATGLTHLGAREYDPSIGRFISVDPLMDLGDPQQNQGYAYAHNNPATLSDPSGLAPADCWLIPGMQCTRRSDGGYDQRMPGESSSSDDGGGDDGDSGGSESGVWEPAPASRGMEVVYAGVEVPVKWKEKKKFQEVLYQEIARSCMGESINCWSDAIYSGGPQADTALSRVRYLTYLACGYVSCPKSVSSWKEGFLAGVALWGTPGVEGGTARGQGGGSRAGGRGGRGSPCLHSFTSGTEVLLEDGRSKPIEEVKTGDKVLAADPETGKLTAREVVATFDTAHDKDFTDLTVETDRGEASIIATDNHPFWEATEKKWVDAGSLRPGSHLRTDKGETLRVKATRRFIKQQHTLDLTVSGVHTYHVLAGEAPVLVHNCTVAPGMHHLPTAAEAQEIIQSAPRASSAAKKSDPYHRAPIYMQDQIAEHGTVWRQAQRDPMNPDTMPHVSVPGEVNGNSGKFHWIVDPRGVLVHEAFEPRR